MTDPMTTGLEGHQMVITGGMSVQFEETIRENRSSGNVSRKYEAARATALDKIHEYEVNFFPRPIVYDAGAGETAHPHGITTHQGFDGVRAMAVIKELMASLVASQNKGMVPAFPPEIMKEIIKHAMTANGGKIVMPCLTKRGFAPNIAVGLLRVNRETYHEALTAMFVHNQFVFDHFGTDLKAFDKPFTISSCRPGACSLASQTPYMKFMRFELGCEVDAEMGKISIENFTNALERIRRPFSVEKLTIHFHAHSYDAPSELGAFTMALARKIIVRRILTITGPSDKHQDEAAWELAEACNMMPYPSWAFNLIPFPSGEIPPFGDHGFSYVRFKTHEDIADYDFEESQTIMQAASKGTYVKGFDMQV